MSLFNRLHLGANKWLGPLGFKLERSEKTNWPWGSPVVTTQVGRYFIEFPRINPLSTLYVAHPDYTSQLGRLASIIRKKYPAVAVIDVGSNVGDTACIIKSAEDIPLLCVEGDDFTFGFLEKNLKQFQNVVPHKLFLGEKTGRLPVRLEKSGWNTTILPGEAGAASIQITTLDDFLATQKNLENFKFLKIDAEGFDCAILRGAGKFIQTIHPVITFEYNRENMRLIGETGIDTLLMLRDWGYSKITFHDARGRFLCLASLEDTSLIMDLHEYVDDFGDLYYYDITVFHRDDGDLAASFVEGERLLRRQNELKY